MAAPKSKPGTRYCPLIKRGCIEDECAWYVRMWGKEPDGEMTETTECAIVLNVVLERETLVETARSSASYDKMTNAVLDMSKLIVIDAMENSPSSLPQ